jgi:hypothetical protein
MHRARAHGRRFVLAAGFVAACAQIAEAQGRAPLTPEQPYRQMIGVNPVILPIGIVAADYERAMTQWLTLGVGGMYGHPADENAAGWVDLKARYYPGEQALKGISVGVSAGWVGAQTRVVDASTIEHGDSGPTLGVLLDYNWLLGKRHHFLVGLGVGARRLLTHVDGKSALDQVMPDVRFVVGLAF